MAQFAASLDDVRAAERRIFPHIRTTPILENPLLNEQLGLRLLLKAESLQRTGAFKARGAFNSIIQLAESGELQGVFAMSAGNHAQGIACAAREFGLNAVILMPHDAPVGKVKGTRAFGGEVVFYNRDTEDRDVIGQSVAAKYGFPLIHSYNDGRTIAGQGTIGLEIYQQCRDLRATPDAIITNCSGGGLASGIALTRDLYETPPRLYVAEPEGFDDAARSLTAGSILKNHKKSGSICDALLLHLGDKTFPILQHHQVQGLSASDDMVQAAMSLAADKFKLVLEPGGAVALATVCLNREKFAGQTVVVVASGSNVDSETYAEHLRSGVRHRGRLLAGITL